MSNLNVNNITPLAGSGGSVGVSGSLNVSGSITLGGNVTANGNIVLGDSTSDSVSLGAEINSNLIPDANVTYDLGSGNKRWSELHVQEINTSYASRPGLSIHGCVSASSKGGYNDGRFPAISSSGHITASGLYVGPEGFNDGYVGNITTIAGTVQGLSGSFTHVSGGLFQVGKVNSDIIPYHHQSYDLGSNTKRWSELHVRTISAAGLISGSSTIQAAALNVATSASISGVTIEGGDLSAVGNISASSIHLSALPTSEAAADSGDLFTLSGSQIFSSSAFPGGSNVVFNNAALSASIFVFQKA